MAAMGHRAKNIRGKRTAYSVLSSDLVITEIESRSGHGPLFHGRIVGTHAFAIRRMSSVDIRLTGDQSSGVGANGAWDTVYFAACALLDIFPLLLAAIAS